MKSLEILHSLLDEASEILKASTKRDWITIQSRFKHEGLEFLTLALPKFAQWFESSIEHSQAGSSIYFLFRKRAGGKSVLPCFLHGLTSKVFDPQSGLLLSNGGDVNAVLFVRQICLLHKKLKVLPKSEKIRKALESYVETDLSLRKSRLPRAEKLFDVQFISETLSGSLGYAYRQTIGTVLPKHGPGATADRLYANAKFRSRGFYSRWSGVFSWEELYGFSTVHQADTCLIWPKDEPPVKVVTVPKTAKGPRIISVEPTAMQYAQQLVSLRLREAFSKCGIDRQLNLNNQTVNQQLALLGSHGGDYATLDLSEASDRLNCKTVKLIFKKAHTLCEHLFACRSTSAQVDKNLVIKLTKFASMGSALTFPVESYCFYVICVAAIYRGLILENDSNWGHKSVGPHSIARVAMKQVFVFGDDIIVPKRFVKIVTDYLESYMLKVNMDKSFSKGLFRESCGVDAYNGHLVSPVYLRQPEARSLRDAASLISWVSTGNQFHLRGFWKTAERVREIVDEIYKFPLVNPRSKAVGWHHYSGAYQPELWDKTQSSWKVRSLVARSSKRSDVLDEYDALLKCQLQLDIPEDKDHLTASPERFSLKLRRSTVNPY